MQEPLRILAVAELWLGSNAYAFARAFRRMGHSVQVVEAENYIPLWKSKPLRALRRLLEPRLVQEYSNALIAEARSLRPHLFFVFKGPYVAPDAVRAIQSMGAVAVNFYPDVSVTTHGGLLPKTLPLYDWVFTTKTFGISDMKDMLGIDRASFLPHGFDPEVHRPLDLSDDDRRSLDCDVSFIGTWSPKKQRILKLIRDRLPQASLRIWGNQWEQARGELPSAIEGRPLVGLEYAKALVASKINLGLLSEVRSGASRGDQITSRTFHIPATGSFMLHERTDELAAYFREGEECGAFDSDEELLQKIVYYLEHDDERRAVGEAGRQRSLDSGYSVDSRGEQILAKVAELRCGQAAAVHV